MTEAFAVATIAVNAADVAARAKSSNYPDDDLKALLVANKSAFVHKDGTPYRRQP